VANLPLFPPSRFEKMKGRSGEDGFMIQNPPMGAGRRGMAASLAASPSALMR
jgi:hypothetical protein